MNTNATPEPTPPRRSLLRSFLIVTAFLAIASVVAVANLLTLSREAAILRDELVDGFEASPSTQIQVSAGPLLLTVVRIGLGFIPDLPEEARLALRAVRKASVGVYQFSGDAHEGRRKMIVSADTRMRRQGWDRVVTVTHDDTLVLAYAPGEGSGWFGGRQKVCVAIFADERLVVVAGTVAVDPLRKLAGLQRMDGTLLPAFSAISKETVRRD